MADLIRRMQRMIDLSKFMGGMMTSTCVIDAQDLSALLEMIRAPNEPGCTPTHRHKRRGSLYRYEGEAQLQTEVPLRDNDIVEVYIGENGKRWARRKTEFHDGRFEALNEEAVP